jgi:hypothetical protein
MSRRVVAQKGQAVTEFVVMSLVAIPLFLGVIYAAKYADVKHAAVQASRYVAWERALDPGERKSNNQIQNEMRVRLLGNGARNGGAIRSDDFTRSNSTADAAYNPLWTSHTHARLLNRLTDATTVGGPQNTALAVHSELLTNIYAAALDENKRGWVRADVEIPLANVPQYVPLRNINFRAGATNVIVGDAWSAGGAPDVVQKVRRMDPEAAVFEQPMIKGIVNLLRGIAALFEPSFANFQPACVAPDVVPVDRLQSYSGFQNCTN